MSTGIFGRYDRQIWILTGGSLINGFGFSIAYPFISLYLFMHRGIPMTDVGIALLIAAAIGIGGQMAGGELCDRIGRKAVMSIGLALNAVAFGLLTAAILFQAGYYVFVVLLCLREIAGGLYRNVPAVMVSDVVPAGDRNGAFSLLRIGGNLGFALGPVIGGILATYSYAYMFSVTMVTSMIFLLITIFLLRDTRPDKCFTGKPESLSKVWSDRPFVWFCIVSGVITIVYSQMLTTFGTYSGSYGQINETYIGLLFSLNGFMIVLFQYPIAVFLERFKLTTSLVVGTLIYAAGFSIVGFSSGFWPLFVCMFIISAGELVYSPSSLNIVSRMASPESRGRYMSFSSVIGNAGFALGPALGGWLMDAFKGDIKMMWLLLGGLALLCVFGYLVLRTILKHGIDESLVPPRFHQ